jgi:chemotaxis protein MotB
VSVKTRRRRSTLAEEQDKHDRWMISYADMLTLLFVLFVVLFAMSNLDKSKYEQLAASLASSFGFRSPVFTGHSAPLDGMGHDASVMPIDPGIAPDLAGAANPNLPLPVDEEEQRAALAAANRARASMNARAAVREVRNFREIERRIAEALKRAGLEDNVRFSIDQRGLMVTVVTSDIIFEGDRAELLPAGRQILDVIAPVLRPLPNSIQVDGHTNQLPVPTLYYPSEWELSTARASTVVRYLVRSGISRDRLSAAGYADTRPLIPPEDPRSVTMNRRVDIVVLSTLPPEQRALLPSAAG